MESATRKLPPPAGTIWYMGVKTRLLRGFIDEAIRERLAAGPGAGRRPGRPLLVDLFAGTGIVGAEFAREAQVVAADAQSYAATLARSLLEPLPRRRRPDIDRDLGLEADIGRSVLSCRYADELDAERAFLDAPDAEGPANVAAYRDHLASGGGICRHPAKELELVSRPGPIMTALYRNVYFGVRQAVEIDAWRDSIACFVRRSADWGEPHGRRLATHYLAALLFAASRATSGTSHFAQPRGLSKPSEVRAVLRRRRIDIAALFRARSAWLARELERRPPLAGHRAIAAPHERLFLALDARRDRPRVVYADPPYTQDNYSRFYHVLEVIDRHAVPRLARDADGALLKGRYPVLGERFLSGFCMPDEVEREFRAVTRSAAERGAAVVWSYSETNGLLLKRWPRAERLDRLRALLLDSYRDVEIRQKPLHHSGSGDKNHEAMELLAIGDGPR